MFENAENLFVVYVWRWILTLFRPGRSISLQFTNGNKLSSFSSRTFGNVHNPLYKMMWTLPLIKMKWEENRLTRGSVDSWKTKTWARTCLVPLSFSSLMTRDIFGKLQSPICGTVEHVAMTNELRAGYLRSRVAVSNKDVVNAPLPPPP